MKVYVLEEMTEETGDKVFDCSVFDSYEKAKEQLFKREKELYRNYDVEENMRHPNGDTDYYPFEEKYPSVHYYDNWGSYYLTIKEMEVQ